MKRICIYVLILLVFLISQSLSVAAESEGSQFFPTTGHNVRGDFLTFFDGHGGLEVFGYPRTDQFVENGRLVQYFQRHRMELWPENPVGFKVQLMLIGNVVLGPGEPPVPPEKVPSTSRYYPETGHTVAPELQEFFDSRGGLDIFGYPIAEPKKEGGLLVQYFQRARMELWDSGLITLGLLGDEYVFRIGGVPASLVAATPQSSGAGATQGPFSSNGSSKIIFQKASGGLLYSIRPDGSGLTQVGTGMDPSLSPDGRRLAYVSWDYPAGIYVTNLENGEKGLVYAVSEARAPMWSPDGGKIAFYTKAPGYRIGRFGKVDRDDFFFITVLDLATGKTSNPAGQPQHSFSPSWSPDGNRLIYKGDAGLYIASDSSTTKINGTDDRLNSPVWSPDGQRIALMYRQHDHWEIGSINVDGSGFRLLTNSLPFTKPANNVSPSWSPDGSQVAFVSDRNGAWEIFAMNADGSSQHRLTDEPVSYDWAMERVVSWGKN